jgi:predicted MPP superfamily phosphohydrolase
MMRFLLILIGLIAYTCFKFVQLSPQHQNWMISLAHLFYILMLTPLLINRALPKLGKKHWFIFFNWIGTTLIGFWATFIMISIPIDIIHLFFSLFNKGFITQTGYITIFLSAVLMAILGFFEVLRGPKIVEVDIPIKNLPGNLENFKIAQLSDLHIGPTIKTPYVEKVVAQTNGTHPDIIVITGDLVDYHTDLIIKHLQPLKNLKAKYGVYYVTGNHEYYWGIQKLLPELEKVGMTILMNENRIIELNGAKILLAGIPDPSGMHKPNIAKASETTTSVDVKILLTHQPNPYNVAENSGYDLQFSGHTHAGQFFPFSLLIPIAHRYYKGLNRHGKMWVYVNPGTGYWGPANRFGVSAEITLAKLISST